MTGARHACAAALIALVMCAGTPAAAQDTRTEAIAAEQASKARVLRPPQPDRAEQIIRWAQEKFLLHPSGFFPTFESVYSGGGFTLGGGYRQFYADNAFWDVKGLYSLKNYKLIEVATISRDHMDGRATFGARAGWRDATQVAFYGIGISSAKDGRANYGFQQTYIAGTIEFRPVEWAVVGGGLGFDNYSLGEGSGNFPSIEERYLPVDAPGLGESLQYVHVDATAAIDWRTSPGYSRRGGYYGVGFHDYLDDNDTFSFKTVDAELIQHIPILRENWVISLRGRLETEIGDSSSTPYFLLPSLGGGSTLRGYDSFRFRDKHSLLMSAEWRWIPNRLGLDMALFYDAGRVAAERKDLGLNGLKSNVGVGIRFHGPFSTPLRVELAQGNEGLHLIFAGSPAF